MEKPRFQGEVYKSSRVHSMSVGGGSYNRNVGNSSAVKRTRAVLKIHGLLGHLFKFFFIFDYIAFISTE